jgi:hypothetical protein
MNGKRIGSYEIVERLPGGGMAEVYRAVQLSLNRQVALKLPRTDMAESAELLTRFRREAELLAALEHESIVRIYGIEEAGGRFFIVMEYMAGGSLEHLLRREGRLDASRARDIAAAIADALAAAHDLNIIHRDIKPGNILFSAGGRPKLADFGIARLLDAPSQTVSQLVGTPWYMSPEHIRGAELSPATDLYSLGVVLFEMLTGRVPFLADTPIGVALKHVEDAAPSPALLAPQLAESMCAIVQRALAKQPAGRFPSARAFRDALLDVELQERQAGRTAAVHADTGSTPNRCPGCGQATRPTFVTCPFCARSLDRAGSSRGTVVPAQAAARRFVIPLLDPRCAHHALRRWLNERRTRLGRLGRRTRRSATASAAIGLVLTVAALAAWCVSPPRRSDPARGFPEDEIPALPPTSLAPPVAPVPEPAARSADGAGPYDREPASPAPAGRTTGASGSTTDPAADDPGRPGAEGRGIAPIVDATERGPPGRPPQPQPAPAPQAGPDPYGEARRQVEAMVARHLDAIRRQDLDALVADASPALESRWRRAFAFLFSTHVELVSQVHSMEIAIDGDHERGTVRLQQRLHGRTHAGAAVTIADEARVWRVRRVEGRWRILEVH